MFSEVTEVRDAIHLLTARAANEGVARDLIRVDARFESLSRFMQVIDKFGDCVGDQGQQQKRHSSQRFRIVADRGPLPC